MHKKGIKIGALGEEGGSGALGGEGGADSGSGALGGRRKGRREEGGEIRTFELYFSPSLSIGLTWMLQLSSVIFWWCLRLWA